MLHLEHLAKVYGDRVVLRDVNASFAAGSVSLLAGNNGAGKSTLLRIVAGLARATSGTVRLADPAPVTAYLGHATFLYPGLSALENLAFWNGVHELRRSRQELLGLLEHVGLAAHAHERAGLQAGGFHDFVAVEQRLEHLFRGVGAFQILHIMIEGGAAAVAGLDFGAGHGDEARVFVQRFEAADAAVGSG